jgi:hypothetical protein
MSPRTLLRGVGRVLLVCMFLAAAANAQAQSTLSGTVFGGGSPLPNTLVEALNDGTTTVAGSATTDVAGHYAISLLDGTYDLRVSPPAGSGFGQEVVQNVAINGDRSYDVILLAAGAGKVFGTVRGYGGNPIGGAWVSAYSQNGQYIASASTNASGDYELVVTGTVNLQFGGNYGSSAPQYWNVYRSGVNSGGSAAVDINLPVGRVSGFVRNSANATVANASLEAYGSFYDAATQTSGNYSAYATTDSSGYYEYFAFNGSSSVTVRPPSGSTLTPVSSSVTVNGDTSSDFTLPSAVILSGTIRGLGGAGLSGAWISVYNSNGQFVASASTDASGYYSVAATPGTVNLQMGGNYNAAAPQYWNAYRSNLSVAGNTTFDLALPVAKLTGSTRDTNAAPVGSVSIEVYGNAYDAGAMMSFNYSAYASSNPQGEYSALVFNGNASVTARPQSNSGLTPFSGSLVVSGDTTFDITLPAAVLISGVVRGYGGSPVQGAWVSVYNSNGQFVASANTDASGSYVVSSTPGSVNLQFGGNYGPNAPQYWNAYRSGVNASGATTVDLNLPVIRLDGTTTDSNGAPVPNVSLEFYGNIYDSATQSSFNYSSYGNSSTTGQYEMRLFRGSASVTVRPPNSSGFLPTQLSSTFNSDLTQRIVLQRPDLSPPQITAGPVVVHLSDTSVSVSWTTNEPSTSVVNYGIGSYTSTAAAPGMVANHIVTLQGLTALQTYDFRIGSSDAAGNGPTYATGNFMTIASPGDITPPHITSGPTVVFVDQTSAIVQWETDEPASSIIAYGQGGALDTFVSGPAGVFTLSHSLTVSGLTSQTTYSAQVTSADPDENTTTSSLFPITTLAVPDTAAPIITAGPTIVSTTDTQIIVSWETNEPSTSGVSFNDGTVFNLVTDNALTSTHQITLSGLSPSTTYAIRVSSTDAVGNGPTLGEPISAATDAEADTTAPTISGVQVSQVTVSSAVITFATDEPAIIIVNYGAGTLDQTRADLSPSTSHTIMLSGLLEGTQYSFTVKATDGSSNSAMSDPFNFTTESSFIDQPPTQPGPISGPPSPTNLVDFTLTWQPSTDDVMLSGYALLIDGTLNSTDGSTAAVISGLAEGEHVFVVRATDSVGHATDSDPFTIVIDRTAPTLTVPGDIVAGTQGTSAVVEYEVTVTDNLAGGLLWSCAPQSGASFPVGTTRVNCEAFDAAGNRSESSFDVTVEDDGPPTLTVPADQVLEATQSGGAVATFSATANDLVDGAVAPSCAPASGSLFALGTTTVWCTASDAAGNEASGSFTVTVRDTAAPAIGSVRPSVTSLWPANHQMVKLLLSVSVTDAGDAAPQCRISSVTSNEPINGLGDGDTSPDWFDVSGLMLSLRAERSGNGNGRIYAIGVTCTDASGNSTQSSANVFVPKNQK